MSEPMRSDGVPGARRGHPDDIVLRLARDERTGVPGGPATGQVPVTTVGRGGRRGLRLGPVPLDAVVAFVIAVVVVAVVLFVLFGLRR